MDKKKLKEKIKAFTYLEKDWCGCAADPPTAEAIQFALELVDILPDGNWHAIPNVFGEIEIEDFGEREVDRSITVFAEKTIFTKEN